MITLQPAVKPERSIFMKAFNLYFLSRIDDEECFSEYATTLSSIPQLHTVKSHEQASLRALTAKLTEQGLDLGCYDGFFLSFVINHISKEFDLLKIAADRSAVLNIELKSRFTDEERIQKQLIQNRYYLRHISGKIFSYTYVLSTDTLFTLGDDQQLTSCDFDSLGRVMKSFEGFYSSDIESLFGADDFLISPGNTPEKFLSHSYFLTTQQLDFKSQIMGCIESHRRDKNEGGREERGCFLSLTGSHGTGKTLLLYDIASDLSRDMQVCLVHCGPISQGHLYLDEHIKNLSVIPSVSLSETQMKDSCDLILVDEAQRFSRQQFEFLRDYVMENDICCVFSFDFTQVLYSPEISRCIVSEMQDISGAICKLSGKIRSNKELSSFIISLFDLKRRTNIYNYDCVNVVYARDDRDAELFKDYYCGKGYRFIDPESVSEVIGNEFNSVLMLMDDSFYYDPEGKLQAEKGGDSELARAQLFQGISRARERICIIVKSAPKLFRSINCIKLRG